MDREFATKPALVRRMLARVVAAGVPFGRFAADPGYGRDPELRALCHDGAIAYAMAVPVDLPLVGARGEGLCCTDVLRSGVHRRERRAAGAGSKGARWYDWVMHAVTVKEQPPAEGFGHTLLIRRSEEMRTRRDRPSSYDIEFFLVHAPVSTTLAAMVRAAGLRWKIEEDNKIGKDQLGMDAYQVRKWTPWYRHVTMCMLAQAFLTVTRAGQGKEATLHESEAAD